MRGLKNLLLEERNHLLQLQAATKDRLTGAPEGSLRIGKSNGNVQYFHFHSRGKHNGTYIPKSEMELVRRLAQKSYDESLDRLLYKRLGQLDEFLEDYDDDEIDQLFNREHEERRKIICPAEPTWEQKLEEWINTPYKGKEFQEGTPEIYSEKGERVRSKSEKILADYFFRNNIPYKYEKPLQLKGFGIIYPDFTFLSKTTGKEIYWEHEGRMDDPSYAKNAVRKIQLYEKNGIFPGENLILTFETEATVINTKEIEIMAQRYLIH